MDIWRRITSFGSSLLNAFRARVIGQSLLTATDELGILAITPKEKFEHNLRMLLKYNPNGAGELLHSAIMMDILDGKEPREAYIKLVRRLGHLKAAKKGDRALYPGAYYEMDGVVGGRVFFRKNLSLAGFKDYQADIETILLRTLEAKHLSSDDFTFLRNVHIPITESMKLGDRYGGVGLPYPDERHVIMQSIRGMLTYLYFDEKFDLVVALKKHENGDSEIFWERPGARQPELYR